MSEALREPAAGDALLGKYSLVRVLGVGGMGRVFEGLNLDTGRRVAIKTLHAKLWDHPTLRKRFLREARAVARVRHPNVVEVFDMHAGSDVTAPFIVYEFLEGESVDVWLLAQPMGRATPAMSLRVMVPVVAAVVAVHRADVVHRDLKPGNVFLTRDARGELLPKLIDFGLARYDVDGDVTITNSDIAVGTPAYMSPEQAEGRRDAGEQSDVWSIGATLYECLTGSLPFDGLNARAVMNLIQNGVVKPILERAPELPEDLASVVMRCLSRDLTERYSTVSDLLEALIFTGTWRDLGLPRPVTSSRESHPVVETRSEPPSEPLTTPPTPPPTEPAPLRQSDPRASASRAMSLSRALTLTVIGVLVGALGALARERVAPLSAVAAHVETPHAITPLRDAPDASFAPPQRERATHPSPRITASRARSTTRDAGAPTPAPPAVTADPLEPERRYP